MEGAGFDLEDTHANLATVTDEDVFFKAGLYHGPRDLESGTASVWSIVTPTSGMPWG